MSDWADDIGLGTSSPAPNWLGLLEAAEKVVTYPTITRVRFENLCRAIAKVRKALEGKPSGHDSPARL